MNIIDQLFTGKIKPAEFLFGEISEDNAVFLEYKRLSEEYKRLYDEIKEELSPDTAKKLIRLSDVQSEITFECDRMAFYKGYVIGSRLTAEVFTSHI